MTAVCNKIKSIVAFAVICVILSLPLDAFASGDSDFDLLLERIANKHGVQTVAYGVPGLTANSLIRAATRYVPIEGSLLLK